jgi:signal transduction histidine kinase
MDEKTGNMEHWLAGFIQKNHVESYQVNNIEHPLHAAQLAGWRGGEKYVSIEMSGPALKSYAKEMLTQSGYRSLPDEEKAILLTNEHAVFNLAYMKQGALMWAPSALSDENAIVLQRFAKVFEQTYTRFLDLKKAESQARRAERDLIEIKAARKKAEDALNALKAMQTQLIQSEKMASLGELTAGIAHEIQNPLNFVNNFSGINAELLDELKAEAIAGNMEGVLALANDIRQNEEKIVHHGTRADSIVKSMLQHSGKRVVVKESTDINALADEFLRLSYHGFRAKDKLFNATIETHFDSSIDKVDLLPQDIGRVLLNLYNNAFYAVQQKQKLVLEGANGEEKQGYYPMVTVSTRRKEKQVEILVRDNGTGIPESVKSKIFQPFFTTKPAGEGTGLGLSLSYDIITKGHGGEFKLETKEGAYAEFTIQLPL